MRNRIRSILMASLLCVGLASCAATDEPYVPTTAEAPPSERLSSRLEDSSQPTQILLVGDDTGTSMGGWIYLTGQALSQKYGRPVELHDWDIPSGSGYLEPPTQVSPGQGLPIVIWNVSVSRNIEYLTSIQGQTTVPDAENVDLVLVNNGLNQAPSTLAKESIPLMRELQSTYPQAAVVAILQPAPVDTPEAAAMASNARDLEVSARINEFQSIDVGAAEIAYDDGSRYPNADGIRSWAGVVTDRIESSITVP